MRYQLDNEGYLIEASFGCTTGMCTEYTGTVPEGYETIEEWYEDNCECVGSWKIVDGNLVYDASRDYKLQVLYEQEAYNNAHVSKKEMGMTSTEEINPYTDLFPSHQSAGGYITYLSEEFNKVGNLPTEEVNLTLHEEQNLDLIELEFIGNNFLPNTASSITNNGITYTQNKDKTISIKGTSTDRSTLNLAGTDTSVRNILTFKKGIMLINTETSEEYLEPYYYNLTGLVDGVSLEFYHYDGTDRTLIGTYNKGLINYDVDVNITQVVLVIESGITIDTTIKPMLSLVSIEHPILPMTKYIGEDTTRAGQYYVDGISTQATISGKNLFNKSITPIIASSEQTITELDTGVKISCTNSSSSNVVKYAIYKLIDLTNYVGKVVRIKCDFSKSNENLVPRYCIGLCDADGNNRTQKSVSITSGETVSFTVPTLDSTSIYLCVWLYFTYATNINSGDYVDFTNLIITVDNSDMTYELYGVMPSPDYPSEMTNLYKAGTYNIVIDNHIYTITIDDDLRGLPNGIGDRLWVNILEEYTNFEIERKVGTVVLDGSESWALRNVNSDTGIATYSVSDVLDYYKRSIDVSALISHFKYLGTVKAGTLMYSKEIGITLYYNESITNLQTIIYINSNITTLSNFKTWLSEHNTTVYYELATYTTTSISEYSYNEYTYEEFKNNSTLIDLKGNTFTCDDKITIKDNQILLIKNGAIDKILDEEGNELPVPREEIYLGDTVMPRTYTPYTNAYCHQRVYIDFKYKDPRNVDITKINLEGLILITNVETEYNFTSDDYTKVKNYIMGTEDLTDEEIELYDVNGDGEITATDYTLIKQMVEGTIPSKITGSLEINSTQSKRTIVLRDSQGNIKTSLGLNGATTPSLSTEEFTLDGVKQPKIMSGTELPDTVEDGAIFLLYE